MKVLKIAAIVVAAAVLVATGVGAIAGGATIGAAFSGVAASVGTTLGVSAGLVSSVALGALAIAATSVVGALAPKPSEGGSQTKWKADPYAGIPYVMGRTLVSGNITYRRGHGSKNTYQTFVTILSLGAIASIDTTFMDKATVAFAANGSASGEYSGRIYQKTQLGACPEAAALVPPIGAPTGWTSQHKLSGLAAAMNTFVYDASGKTTFTTILQPAWIIHGVKVYDPRLDSTYPGGSGSCRAYDEGTYVWSENPHLHALTWALGRYQNGTRVAGIGVGNTVPTGAVKSVDIASFVDGANLDDARGWKLGGQVFTRPDTPWNSLKAMLQAGGAQPVLIGGRISSINRAPRVSLATITRSDIIGKCTFAGTALKRGRINGIIPQYRSEAHDWEMVSAAGVSVASYVALDGDEETREISYPLVQDVNQVAQLATYDICDAREAGPGTVPLKPLWLNYRIGDCVTFAPEDGYSIKTVITGRAIDAQSGTVTATLRGETDDKHAFALGKTGTAPQIVSLSYDQSIAAPNDDWGVVGTTISNNGSSIPALLLTGACGDSRADAIIVDYRVFATGLSDDDGWAGASTEPATLTRKEITSVSPGTQYQVGVRYRVRGVLGPRAIFDPVTTGNLVIPGLAEAVAAAQAAGKFTVGGGFPVDAKPGDTYVDAAGIFYQRVESGGILLGGNVVTLAGYRPVLAWTLAPTQPLRDFIATALAADAAANSAIDMVTGLADDGVLSQNEKFSVLIPAQARFEEKWAALSLLAATLNIDATAAANAHGAWLAFLGGLSPAWNDTTQDTAVNRTDYNTARANLDAALYNLDQTIAVSGAQTALYPLITGTPNSLGDINGSEGGKLASVAVGADVTSQNTAANTAAVGAIGAGAVSSTINTGGGVATNNVSTSALVPYSASRAQFVQLAADVSLVAAGAVTVIPLTINKDISDSVVEIKANIRMISNGDLVGAFRIWRNNNAQLTSISVYQKGAGANYSTVVPLSFLDTYTGTGSVLYFIEYERSNSDTVTAKAGSNLIIEEIKR